MRDSGEIVSAIIGLAHTLRLDVIAEGVETPRQRARLAGLGCEFAQGYLFSAPKRPDLITQLIPALSHSARGRTQRSLAIEPRNGRRHQPVHRSNAS